jgi:hypothetical protein
MTTFIPRPPKKFGGEKWHQNNPGSNGREETSPGPLLLTIKVTYMILKNKSWRNRPHKLGIITICIRFYCDMKPTSKTVVPQLVRTTLFTVLYETDVCMKLFNMTDHVVPRLVRTTMSTVLYETDVCVKLFNMTSPKFSEEGGTNMQQIKATHGLCSIMASGPGDRRLYYKKKMMATKVTLEIILV